MRVVGVCCVLLVSVGLGVRPGVASCGLCGDANGDGVIAVSDAELVAAFTVGLVACVPCPIGADVAGPRGVLNIVDALYIGQFVAGLRSTLVCASGSPILRGSCDGCS